MVLFINARLVLPDRISPDCYLLTDCEKIANFGKMKDLPEFDRDIRTIDVKGNYLSPGFIDMHVHGGGGYDFMDGTAEDIIHAARAHMRHGTTSIMPTTLTSTDEDLYAAIRNYQTAEKCRENMPDMLGLHLEGPYFSPHEKGAQPESLLQIPRPEHYMKIIEMGNGCIRRWSLAPELPGAMEMADRLVPMGILIAAGHTAATYQIMKEAVHHGFSHLTHFYSGMSSITRVNGYRILGVVESGYLIGSLTVELIADGRHLPPELLKMILKFKDHDHICLCTDAMRGADMPTGPSLLGPRRNGVKCVIENGVACMPDHSGFAGSVATTDRLVRVMTYEAGLPLWEAVRMASYNTARILHIDAQKGSIAIGNDADLIIFDADVRIKTVMVKGIIQDITVK